MKQEPVSRGAGIPALQGGEEVNVRVGALTYDEVLADLEAIIAEMGAHHVYLSPDGTGPDGVDGTCQYVHTAADGSRAPGCLIGVWLARRGVDLATMAAQRNRTADVYVPALLRDKIEVEALYLLRRTQAHQDLGRPWGSALARARDAVAAIDWAENPWVPGEET